MNDTQIKSVLQRLQKLGIINYFIVTDKKFSAFPSFTPCVIIQNTKSEEDFFQNPDQFGHWICYYSYLDDNKLSYMYFDSYGKSPQKYDLQFPKTYINSSDTSYQSLTSKTCGLYCLFFTVMMSLNISLLTIHSMLEVNKCCNDKLLLEFYETLLKSNTKRKTVLSVHKLLEYYRKNKQIF